ncbi:hypothetical protein FIBSPDRAFT_257118 [Athelia psychrophila]|uniref:Uncharacterized protein n=1 Tax=Athelia psychrophila TaxID=1759441 RepID=A0A165XKJ7_9AGAM|nr:hypothetical protein FIBSPDRAFT_257118 [Fibularhizoctonia sp. CBS 109695]
MAGRCPSRCVHARPEPLQRGGKANASRRHHRDQRDPLAVRVWWPAEDRESKTMPSAYADGGISGPMTNGTDTGMPTQEPAIFADELSLETSVKAAAELRRAQMAKERDLTDCALPKYYDSNVYKKRFSQPDGNVVWQVVDSMKRENYKQDLVDFIGSYIAEKS